MGLDIGYPDMGKGEIRKVFEAHTTGLSDEMALAPLRS